MNPDIVVLGLNMENFWRNLNTFRPKYFSESGIFFTKPRAIVLEDSLCWKNVPTIHPTYILDSVIKNFDQSDLSRYEYFNRASLHSENILNNSFFYLFIRGLFISDQNVDFKNCPEGDELIWSLISAFSEEVINKGSDFIILQLLQSQEIERIKYNQELDYQKLLNRIINTYQYCSTEGLLEKYDAATIYEQEWNHPNAVGNKLIGEHLAEYLIKHQKLLRKVHLKNSKIR